MTALSSPRFRKRPAFFNPSLVLSSFDWPGVPNELAANNLAFSAMRRARASSLAAISARIRLRPRMTRQLR